VKDWRVGTFRRRSAEMKLAEPSGKMSRRNEPYAAAAPEAMSPWPGYSVQHSTRSMLPQPEDDGRRFEALSRCNEQWRLCVWWSEVNQLSWSLRAASTPRLGLSSHGL
jgi:hypothetical protein